MPKPEIEIKEFESRPTSEITATDAQLIQAEYSGKLDISRPLLGSGYILKASGWVGRIELENSCISIQPKVPIINLFWMLERAYKEIIQLKGKVDISSLTALNESLMGILASKSLDLASQGLYRSYINCNDTIPCLRGRIDINEILKTMRNCSPNLPCNFQEHTSDILENRAITWVLWSLSRIGIKRDEIRKKVFRTFHIYSGAADIERVSSEQLRHVKYNRLTERYRLVHALCLFFLENMGPLHGPGGREFVPFLIDMEGVYEKYVAEALKLKMPHPFLVSKQETRFFDDSRWLRIRIDIVMRNSESNKIIAVLDTKYKIHEMPDMSDIFQIFSYAQSTGANNAILIYPWTGIDEKPYYFKGCRIIPLGIDVSNEDMDKAENDLTEKIVKILEEH